MNHDSKKFLYWSVVTVAYFVGLASAIEFNFNGFITILIFWAFMRNLYTTYQYAKTADLFIWVEEDCE